MVREPIKITTGTFAGFRCGCCGELFHAKEQAAKCCEEVKP